MPNFFDQFDTPTPQPPTGGGNYFDQFDVRQDASGLPPPTARITVRPQGAETASAPVDNTGFLRAGAVGLAQGATANFADEIGGVANAVTQTQNINPAGGLTGIGANITFAMGQLALEAIKGERGPATQAYEAARDKLRAEGKQAKQDHPNVMLGGEIAGAFVNPLARVAAGGVNLAQRMGRGAVAGGLFGAASGAGEGESLPDRASRALSGGAIGAGVGAIAPPIIGGIARGVGAVAAPAVSAVRGLFSRDAEAARRVSDALRRDAAIDPNAVRRLSPAEFTNARIEGQPVANLDRGGEATRGLARSAANTSPEGRAVLNQTINDRFEGQSGRITNWLRGAFHYPNADAQQQAIEQTARAANRGAYGRAYRDGDRQIWSPTLERLTSSPDVVAAMREAATKGKSRAVVEGYGGFNPGVTVDNGGIVTFRRGPTGQPVYPNLQFWDYTKRALDDAANAARRAGRNDEAGTLGSLARNLRAELDNVVPSYGQARAGAAHFFGAQNAMEAGQNYVRQEFATPATRRALAAMSPTERQLFQDGFVSRYIEILERTGDRRNILNQISANPAAREKLNVALGPQRAAELEARLRVEGIMDLARSAVQGNSTTARQLAELGLAGGVGGYGVYTLDPTALTVAALIGARRGIDTRVARRVAEMLASNDPTILQRGIQLVARNQNFMNNLRAFDQRLGSVAGQQGTGAGPAIQGPMPGRAEQEQQ